MKGQSLVTSMSCKSRHSPRSSALTLDHGCSLQGTARAGRRVTMDLERVLRIRSGRHLTTRRVLRALCHCWWCCREVATVNCQVEVSGRRRRTVDMDVDGGDEIRCHVMCVETRATNLNLD
jgi:hypothetical protein